MSGGSPAAFAMNSMLGFDKLALKYQILLTRVVRSSLLVRLVTHRYRQGQQGSRFFMQICGLWL
jgi:hypothetical protein